MKISNEDERNLYRLLDGELPPDSAAALRARVEAEPDLRQHFARLEAMRVPFLQMRGSSIPGSGPVANAGFTAKVLAATRRLPDRQALERADIGEGIARFCRRLLLAAAIIVGLGALWHSGILDGGILHGGRAGTLEAAPEEIQKELQRLDALIESGAIGERKGK